MLLLSDIIYFAQTIYFLPYMSSLVFLDFIMNTVLQGGEGDCFYVVGDGEFEVLANQVHILSIWYLKESCLTFS